MRKKASWRGSHSWKNKAFLHSAVRKHRTRHLLARLPRSCVSIIRKLKGWNVLLGGVAYSHHYWVHATNPIDSCQNGPQCSGVILQNKLASKRLQVVLCEYIFELIRDQKGVAYWCWQSKHPVGCQASSQRLHYWTDCILPCATRLLRGKTWPYQAVRLQYWNSWRIRIGAEWSDWARFAVIDAIWKHGNR